MRTYMTNRKVHPMLMILALGGLLATASGCIAGHVDETGTGDEEPLAEATQAITWNGHSYLFLLGPNTWDQAANNCSTNGYYLATVNDYIEQNWLASQINSYGGNWYIGLNDKAYEAGTNPINNWLWVNGSSTYRNWYPGQPNNNDNQDCVSIDAANGLWGDGWCTSKLRFICERDY